MDIYFNHLDIVKSVIFILFVILFIIAFITCNKYEDAKELLSSPISNFNDTHSSPNHTKTLTSDFNDSLRVLYLGLIGLLRHQDIMDSISHKAGDTLSFDRVPFEWLTNIWSYLVDTMKASVLTNGGTIQQANALPSILDGFIVNDTTYAPLIYFPWNEISDTASNVLLATGMRTEPDTLSGQINGNGESIEITESLAKTNKFWLISAETNQAAGWWPWRRCWCVQAISYDEQHQPYPNGNGECSGTKDNLSQWAAVCSRCGRSGFSAFAVVRGALLANNKTNAFHYDSFSIILGKALRIPGSFKVTMRKF